MNKRQMRQGGSALIYALVAGILVVVLVGGLYGLRQYNETSTEVATDNSKQEKQSSDKKDTSSTSSSETTPQQDTKQDTSSTAGSDSTSSSLPATGPATTLGHLLAIVALTFAIVSYVTSRSAHWTSREK